MPSGCDDFRELVREIKVNLLGLCPGGSLIPYNASAEEVSTVKGLFHVPTLVLIRNSSCNLCQTVTHVLFAFGIFIPVRHCLA